VALADGQFQHTQGRRAHLPLLYEFAVSGRGLVGKDRPVFEHQGLLKDPPILIFDEATSALNSATGAKCPLFRRIPQSCKRDDLSPWQSSRCLSP
jgi:ABC-type transport system involved in Fe-S cluster assembly fused permease/ATPase subunit